MKKKIFFSVLIILFAIVTMFVVSQWNNISAFIDGIRYDDSQLEQKAVKTEEKVNEYLQESNLNQITPMTPEQEKALQSGEISPEDAVKVMTGSMTFEEAKTSKNDATDTKKDPAKPSEPPKDKDEPQKSETIDYNVLISEKIAQLYIVKSNFYAEFNGCWAREKARFLELPKEQRTQAKILEIVKQCIPDGVIMEKECDAEVDAILKEVKALLKKAGREDTLTDNIKKAYEAEKKSMKARLINKYF